jgi:signal transduction histidine kinase
LLGVLREHGVRFVRSDGRGPDNTIPAPFTQPYWYSEDGFPELLELPLQYWHDNVLKGYTTAHVLWPPLPPWGLPAAPPETPEEEFAVFRQGANYVLQTGLRVYQPTLHPWSICRMSPVARQIDLLLDYVREQGMEIVACAEVHRRAREGTEPFPQAKPTHLAQDGHTWPRPSLLADAHHDARASLHPIVGFAELLATGAFGPLTPKQQEAADEILRCAERLAYGLEQLVIAEKLQARRVIARPEVLSVAAVARQVQAQARDLSGGRAEVDVVLEPGAKAVLADEERLLDITGVLVRNAVGYHPGDPRLRLTARRRGDRLEIELGDDGPGLPTGLGNRVFRPLVRGPGPPQALPPGLGLGLTIGSAMARLVGGELRLQPGPGAVFVLDLPAAEPPDSDG